MYRSFFKQYQAMTEETHDPLPRKLPEEPHLTLLARDWRSPGLGRVYAAIREGRWAHAHQILETMEGEAGKYPREPHKDKEHAWSARAKADEMQTWFVLNREAEGARNRVNTTAGDAEP